MKRFLAISASVVMIIVAIVIRSSLDSGGSSTTQPSGPITIACVTELKIECNRLSGVTVRVEDAAVTAKALANGTAHIDGWVTFDPWPSIANELAQRGVTGDSTRVSGSALVIAMVQERAVAFAPTCGGAVTWRCLGDAIGKPWTDVGGQVDWGAVRAGIPPTSTALGLLILGNAASDYFGRADFATNDFDDNFTVWRSKMTAAPASFADFIVKFPAAFSAVGTTDVEFTTGKGARSVVQIGPQPSASATVMITSVDSKRALRFADDLAGFLTRAGWQGPSPEPVGLPNPGVLLALSGLTR